MAVVTKINKDEYKDINEVSTQIRTAVLRDKKFEMLAEKMKGATLEEVAENAGGKVDTFENVKYGLYYIPGVGVEPRLLGAIAVAGPEDTGKVSAPVQGNSGVYVYVVDEVTVGDGQTAEDERVKLQAQSESYALRRAMLAIQQLSDVKDYSVKYF